MPVRIRLARFGQKGGHSGADGDVARGLDGGLADVEGLAVEGDLGGERLGGNSESHRCS